MSSKPFISRISSTLRHIPSTEVLDNRLRFHPATQRVKEIVESGELGRVKSAKAGFAIPTVMSPFFFLKDDIRFNYDLGGGCSMDMGGMLVHCISSLLTLMVHHSLPRCSYTISDWYRQLGPGSNQCQSDWP